MNIPRRLPIGVQSFKDLREKDFLYVDKTEYLFRLANSSKVYFLSRPRRFGKSLFLSTLAVYFLGQKELFKGLYLEKAEEEQAAQENRTPWQAYPVLYLDFNTENYNDENSMHTILHTHLSQWEKQYESDTAEQTFSSRFKGIIQRAYQQTGKQVVILVDEYDKPLLQTMGVNEKLNEHYRNALKAFYSVIKTCDEYIRFAFLTGVTKFSKISIFSDLNNLKDISLHETYAGICGISQKELESNFQHEIQALAEKQTLNYPQTLASLKQWYDGYLFHPAGEGMYNPYSILNAFDDKEIKSYWFSTGTPTFLVNYLKEAHYYIPDLDGNVELDEDGLQTYRAVAQDVLPILFQAGYLTIKKYISDLRLYQLGFPNNEVRYGFLHNLLPAYSDVPFGQTGVWVGRFVQDIRNGNVNGFMERMQSIIAGIPYDDFPKEKLKLREQNYQTAVYLVFALMGQFVQTEVHCYSRTATDGGGSMQQRRFGSAETRSQNYTRMYSFGVDAVVTTADSVYIFEFKLSGNSGAEDAINQIKEQNYAAKYKVDGKKIVLIGAGFDEEKRTIKEWKVERL
ncbi:ATP-binding protein [Treponema sp. OMZ 857]|uniref:ATP-binding protein n=1 Tax=Treponema sp. OMZ 857 TaxID=1643513 RepID=UPI0020A4C390|nr:ATP-binding protein [Treponema sp. OMZ 857]UTC43174.1 ATP-binding protein [Treponema sp. OMZ 857]